MLLTWVFPLMSTLTAIFKMLFIRQILIILSHDKTFPLALHMQVKKMCYLTMVHAILEYASIIWCPHTSCNIHKLEMVQHRAARFIWQTAIHPQSVYLRSCITLTYQHLKYSITIWNWLWYINWFMAKSKLKVETISFKQQAAHRSHAANNFLLPHSKIDAHLYSYYPSTSRLWNGLSSSAVESDNINLFK